MTRWVSRSCFRGSLVGGLIILGYLYLYPRSNATSPLDIAGSIKSSDTVSDSGRADRIVVSVKTGASEAGDRIPAQMQTFLRDVQNVVIFSDLEQDIGEYHLYDALDTIPLSIVQNNPDFDFYSKQKELWKASHNLSSLRGAKHPTSSENLAAWTLDKYKNIHMLEKTWALKPNMDWYLFIDADTYLIWSNMQAWLATLNPKNKYYFGSAVFTSGTTFAHGGTGIVLSGASMYELVVNNEGTAALWDDRIHGKCCGDLVLGMALKDCGVTLQDVWPLMSGEAPATMPFGAGTPEYWCKPALSMHHLSPEEMRNFADFEDRRINKSELLTHTEIFQTYVQPLMLSERENWDNLASEKGEFGKTGGVTSDAASFEDCAHACEMDEKCFQYSHHERTCNIGMSVRLGYRKEADGEGTWRSGWNTTRLAEWASKQPLCDHGSFPEQDT